MRHEQHEKMEHFKVERRVGVDAVYARRSVCGHGVADIIGIEEFDCAQVSRPLLAHLIQSE